MSRSTAAYREGWYRWVGRQPSARVRHRTPLWDGAPDLFEELDDRLIEQIVAVTGHHVTGARNVEDPGLGDKLLKLSGMFLTHHIAQPSSHQHGRKRQVAD